MLRRISRHMDKSKIKFLTKMVKRDASTDRNRRRHGQIDDAKKRLQRTRKQFREYVWDCANSKGQDINNRVLTWLLGAIPIAAVACVTWIPELRSIDLGVTETLTQGLRMAGEYLVSVGGK